MADIRIKDLTTLESASLTGDVFVIDGTTGTRKLSAFSPTFGGNATVTGTLTVNGSTLTSAGSLLVNGATSAALFSGQATVAIKGGSGGAAIYLSDATGSTPGATSPTLHFASSTDGISLRASSGVFQVIDETQPGAGDGSLRLSVTNAGVVSIPATTASTTTSSGALVVGNGTSGGLGVGGSVNINNNLTLGYASAGDSVLKIIRSSGGNEWLQIAGWSAGSLGNNAYSIDAVNGASARPVYFRRSTDAGSTYTNFLTWDTSNNATFDGRITSSTNTDSGVLQLNLVNSSTGTSASSLFRFNAGTRTATLQAYNDTHATLAGQLRVGTSNGDIVLIPSGVATATFGASSVAFGSAANVTVASTTNASSTSFAALVVSGGVGVAKRIVSGEGLTTNGDNETQISFVRNGTISIGPTSAATPKLAVGGGLQLSNTSQSISAWGDIGPQLSIAGAVITDTTSSGTVSRAVANSINATAFAASSSTTYTQAVSLFIADAPTANTNVTISHRYALYTAGGRINFQGLPTSSAGLQAGTLWNDGGTLKVA